MLDREMAENVFYLTRISEHLIAAGEIQVDDDDDAELFYCILDWAKEFSKQFNPDSGKNYLWEIESYADRVLRGTFPPTAETGNLARKISFTLPNGATIVGALEGDENPDTKAKRAWSSMAISVNHPNGLVDYVARVSFYRKDSGLYEEDTLSIQADEGLYERKYPLNLYSIWASCTDGDKNSISYAVNVLDEYSNKHVAAMEVNNLSSEEEAVRIMLRIMDENPNIRWDWKPTEQKPYSESEKRGVQ